MFSHAAQTNQPVIFPGDDPQNPQNLKLVWPATPGIRYEVIQSTNLQSWTTAPGFPAVANGPAQQMPFQTTGNAGFFKVNQLDEQPPDVVSQYPADGGFAVPRFSDLTMQLSDATGIDTNSIQLTIGSLGTFTLTNAQLTFSNNLLTFLNGGSIPLGGWGSNIQATLVMADTLGNITTNTWSFTLESQPLVVTNLFVFGSPQAQRVGQQIGNIPTRALVKQSGPVPMDSGYPWTLASVASNYLILSYTNTAPGFTTGQYVCNLTPVSPAEIFNRKITSISDDPGNKLLTLFTIEVPITEIATNGSASISSDSMILQMGTNGAFTKAFSVSGTVTFPRIGYSLDGADFKLRQNGFESTIDGVTLSVGDPPDLLHVTAEQLHWWLTPQLQASIEINWGSLQRFQAIASGNVDQASIFDADVLLAGADVKQTIFELPPGAKPEMWVFLGSIGPVPVFASLSLNLKVEAEEEAQATLSFRSGESQSVDASFGVTYNSPNDVEWVHSFNFPPPTVVPFTANINTEGSVKLSLEPDVEFLVYGLAGVSAGITPSASVVFQAGTSQPLSGNLEADVSLDLGLAGPAFEALNFTPQFSLSLWSDEWHLFPNQPNISFDQQPQSQSVTVGGSANFSCTVAATGTPSYQWYFNNIPMPGQTSRTLSIASVNSGHAGNYYVQVSAGGQMTNSILVTLTVLPKSVQSGLVAWYPFDGSASDASGNGNNAIIHGALPCADRFGNANSAYSFDGASQYLECPNFQGANANYMSVSAWIYKPAFNPSLFETVFATESCRFQIVYGVALQAAWTDGANSQQFFAAINIQSSAWHHVMWVRDGTVQRFYFDGMEIPVTGYAINNNYVATTNLVTIARQINSCRIGVDGLSQIGGIDWFNGKIDDVRIYNRALSASEILQLYNASLPVPAPASGMALIPAGSFTMGNCMDPNEGWSEELPLHTVYISAFYMDKYDVTKALWDSVYQWAITHGYSFEYGAQGKANTHPAQSMTWYDAVKWCNARSEKEGKTPAYYTSAAQTTVYRSGQVDVDNSWVKWNAGYRLPTEAEWEKAARGGVSGQRFPGGNTISWSQANYYAYPLSAGGYAYDVNPTQGYNPTFNDGVWPFTSPVGYFAPNGYGLYDMGGNVWQWCWDWYGDYSSGSQTDPRGPPTGQYGSNRVLRGGCYIINAFYCRSASRFDYWPDDSGYVMGFRSVLPTGQ
jgi:formylglycine-generating enzyme required for sulfatase activity